MSGLLMGFSINLIFVRIGLSLILCGRVNHFDQLGLFNYLIDVYLYVAASALAGSTVIRSLCGAGFPVYIPFHESCI